MISQLSPQRILQCVLCEKLIFYLQRRKSVTFYFSGYVVESNIPLYIKKKSYSEISKVFKRLVITHTHMRAHSHTRSSISITCDSIFEITQMNFLFMFSSNSFSASSLALLSQERETRLPPERGGYDIEVLVHRVGKQKTGKGERAGNEKRTEKWMWLSFFPLRG